MRVIATGQVGVDKGPFLESVQALARSRGQDLQVFHVGRMMYEEAPDVPPGRILNLPITRLNTLRRAVFKEILRRADQHQHVIINTHATFRWRHGLFAAFDFDQLKAFDADLYITVLDNIEDVHDRLTREHDSAHSLKDLMVWREEELLATEIVANIARGYGHFFMLSRGRGAATTAETLYRLLFEPHRRKVYLSFPITHVMDLPDTLAQIDAFKSAMSQSFTCFDPADLDEYLLHVRALQALQEGKNTVQIPCASGQLTLKTADVAQISSDILGQIYARDFKMIDQSDMIVSLIPELPGGTPAISSGVERELQHAFETGREVYVIWQSKKPPSPFVTGTATKVFLSIDEALQHFREKKYTAGASPSQPESAVVGQSEMYP